MGRRKTVSYIRQCKICGKDIKQTSQGKGLCQACKEQIMSEWGKIPFEQRYLLLRARKVAIIDENNCLVSFR